jgi:ATP-dependent HslUV protease subunit HslV
MLRRLEALLIVADSEKTFLLSGNGDVLEPDDGIVAIGSGGNYALAAARALIANTDMEALEIARTSMKIASEICVYTNGELVIEHL